MTPEQFVYWLQGYMEIQNPEKLDERQTQIIKDHIAQVLKKETPTRVSSPESPLTKGLEDYFKSPLTVSETCNCGSILCQKCRGSTLVLTC